MKTKLKKRIALVMLMVTLAATFALPVGAADGDKSPNTPPSTKTKVEETVQATQEEEKKELKPFDLGRDKISALYTAKSGSFTVSPIRKSDPDVETFSKLMSSLEGVVKPANVDEIDAAKSIEASFLVVRADGERTIYTFIQNNRIMVNGTQGFTIPADTYQSLMTIYGKKRSEANYAQWLIYMKPGLITDITYDTGDGKAVSLKDSGHLNDAIALIRGIRPASATSEESYDPYETKMTAGNGTTKVTIHFEDDGYYDLFFTGNTLRIEAKGYHIGRKYTTVSGEGTRILGALKSPTTAFAKKDTPETKAA